MRRLLAHEKIRFLIVGVLNTALDFMILNILVLAVGIATLPANIISVTTCICISYFLNHYFVFQHESKANFRSFAVFLAVTGFSSIIMQSLIIWAFEIFTDSSFGRSLIIINVLADKEALELNTAKAAAVGIGMVWNFLLYKYVVFRKASDRENIEG